MLIMPFDGFTITLLINKDIPQHKDAIYGAPDADAEALCRNLETDSMR
jgi:hypothetical protein